MRGGCCSCHLRREHLVAVLFVFLLPYFLSPAAALKIMSAPILLLLDISKRRHVSSSAPLKP